MNLVITIIAVVVISITYLITIKVFTKDNKHDLEIQIGKHFKFSIKKHD